MVTPVPPSGRPGTAEWSPPYRRTLQKDKLPKGVDPARIQKLAPRLEQLTQDSGLDDAKRAIEESAESECNIALGD